MTVREEFVSEAYRAIKKEFAGVSHYTIGPFKDGAVVIGVKIGGGMSHVTATPKELTSMAHDISGLAASKASAARAAYDRAG